MTFDTYFKRDALPTPTTQDFAPLSDIIGGVSDIQHFLATHAGGSFANGLYRIHHIAKMRQWTDIVANAFPAFERRIFCFSYDWLGRHFALDRLRSSGGQSLILMMEPGTGQALEIPTTFSDFHNSELVQYRNEALSSDFYESWIAQKGRVPSFGECVGYKKPLFLSGSDTVDNLEVVDMDVYWSISGQLLERIRNLPDGTRVGDIRIG